MQSKRKVVSIVTFKPMKIHTAMLITPPPPWGRSGGSDAETPRRDCRIAEEVEPCRRSCGLRLETKNVRIVKSKIMKMHTTINNPHIYSFPIREGGAGLQTLKRGLNFREVE